MIPGTSTTNSGIRHIVCTNTYPGVGLMFDYYSYPFLRTTLIYPTYISSLQHTRSVPSPAITLSLRTDSRCGVPLVSWVRYCTFPLRHPVAVEVTFSSLSDLILSMILPWLLRTVAGFLILVLPSRVYVVYVVSFRPRGNLSHCREHEVHPVPMEEG